MAGEIIWKIEAVSERLADDLSQRGGVTGEGAAALDGGQDFGSRLLALKEFANLDVACVLQFFEVRAEVSIGELVEACKGREGEDLVSGERNEGGHELEAGGLMDD